MACRHADPQRQYQHDDASRDHASVTVTPCRLFACSIALGSNSSIFLSLSNAVSCGLKMFWNVLKCILLCKFVVVVCHVCCAAAYFTKVFVFYFLSFFIFFLLNCHYSLLSFWPNILWFVWVLYWLCYCVWEDLFCIYLRLWMLCYWVFWDFESCVVKHLFEILNFVTLILNKKKKNLDFMLFFLILNNK